MGIYCYKFHSRHCFKCVSDTLVCCVFILTGFENIFVSAFVSLFFPVVIQEPFFQFPCSYGVLSEFPIMSSNLIALWSDKLVSVLLHFLRSDLVPIMWSILEYILWIWGGDFCGCLLGPLGLDLSSRPGCPC